MRNPIPPRIALVACRVFEAEIATHGGNAPHVIATRILEVGLHDHPDGLRKALQCEVDALDARNDIDVVVLVYALCGRGTSGLRAGRHRLVIPRGHDCITVFMGDKEKFACQQAAAPDSYYYTPGWMQANRTPGPGRLEALRAELSEKFDQDNVDFLVETEKSNWAQHGKAVYLDLATPGADDKAQEAESAAKSLGWKFERIKGDPTLLRDLIAGRWDDERFQIVEPGCVLRHSPDAQIFRQQKAD
ncbi:MAG: DUF1638 domain-containing protein [Verrucomicrobiota bacterium]